jgi:hypothetical protein
MSLFQESEKSLDELQTLDAESLEAPEERLGSPEALRGIYQTLHLADGSSSYNRALVQGQMDFQPPHDDAELENKGQSDRFNITTGEGPAIKNEAVAAYMDIYTTPRFLAKIPLTADVDKYKANDWSEILQEEFTTMDRADDASLPLHLQLADTYVTHGVAIAYFDDKQTMKYSVAGLDHFKFPRNTGIVSSEVEMCVSLGEYTVTELYSKITNKVDGWDEDMIKKAILYSTAKENDRWDDWEKVQRDIKQNEIFVQSVCKPVEVIHGWVTEFDGKVSYYISARHPIGGEKKEKEPEEFLFKSRNFFDSIDEGFQLFPFSVGNGGKLYTVRGLGYLIYQLCNAMDIMHCKLLDNARIASSLIVQPASADDVQDFQLIDFGGGVALPPNMKIPERQFAQNLNNSLIPAISASRSILDRATGGLASSNQILGDENSRQTKLEVSSKLDYINKLNSFAINLFYGPYDKIIREKVKRAFTVKQKDKKMKEAVSEMKQRCINRGVPEEVFDKIDLKAVKASRIIGTGSRSSRIMLMDQMQQMYSTWDAEGRANFEYDYLMELAGVDVAERYAGKATEKRKPYDFSIAQIETFHLLEGDYLDPVDGQDHMVHLAHHLEVLESGLQGVDEGQVDLMEWTMEHNMLYQHIIATLEVTTVHKVVQPELNAFQQRTQQIGEIIVNGLKMVNKAKRDGEMQQDKEGQELSEQDARQSKVQMEMQENDAKHQQKLKQDWQGHMMRLEMIKQAGQQKQVLASQDAMSKIVSKDAESQRAIQQAKSKLI